jgi:hypothetical protein
VATRGQRVSRDGPAAHRVHRQPERPGSPDPDRTARRAKIGFTRVSGNAPIPAGDDCAQARTQLRVAGWAKTIGAGRKPRTTAGVATAVPSPQTVAPIVCPPEHGTNGGQ